MQIIDWGFDDLDEVTDWAEEQQEGLECEKRFVIDSDEKAEWACRQIMDERDEAEKVIKRIQAQIDFYKDRLNQVTIRTDRRVAGLEYMLQEFAKTVEFRKTKTGKSESYELASCKLVIKHNDPEVVRDEDALLKWAKVAHPECIKVTEKTSWSDLKAQLKVVDGEYVDPATGEIVDGITLVPREDTFCIK